MNKFQVGDATVILVKGDITDMPVDAIVNAADSSLMGGGGVDGAIHRNGGPRILEECKQLRARDWPKGLPTGKAALTSGGDLKAKCVIHTVGPCGPAEATEKLGCWLRLMLARSSWQFLRSLSLLPFHR